MANPVKTKTRTPGFVVLFAVALMQPPSLYPKLLVLLVNILENSLLLFGLVRWGSPFVTRVGLKLCVTLLPPCLADYTST